MRIRCPGCGRVFEIGENADGWKFTCPVCRKTLRVRVAPAAPKPDPSPAEGELLEPVPIDETPAPRREREPEPEFEPATMPAQDEAPDDEGDYGFADDAPTAEADPNVLAAAQKAEAARAEPVAPGVPEGRNEAGSRIYSPVSEEQRTRPRFDFVTPVVFLLFLGVALWWAYGPGSTPATQAKPDPAQQAEQDADDPTALHADGRPIIPGTTLSPVQIMVGLAIGVVLQYVLVLVVIPVAQRLAEFGLPPLPQMLYRLAVVVFAAQVAGMVCGTEIWYFGFFASFVVFLIGMITAFDMDLFGAMLIHILSWILSMMLWMALVAYLLKNYGWE